MSLTLAIGFAQTNGRVSFRHRSIRVGRQMQRFEHRSIFYAITTVAGDFRNARNKF